MFRHFLTALISVIFLAPAAHSEDFFAMTLPIGWGDIANHELCKVIIETGGIDCNFVELPSVLGPISVGVAHVTGDRAAIENFVVSHNVAARRPIESYEQFFAGDFNTISVTPNGCEVMLLPEGCTCSNSPIGGPNISCPNPVWSIGEGVTKMGGEIPWPLIMSSIRDFGVLKRISQ